MTYLFLGSFYLPTNCTLPQPNTQTTKSHRAAAAAPWCWRLKQIARPECTDAYHTPWATPPPLGLVKIRWGDELLINSSPRHICPFFLSVRYQQIARPVGKAMTHPSAQLSSKHHWKRHMRLVWSKSFGGTNSYYHYNHHVNGGLFMQLVISKSLGKWLYESPSDCTVAIHILLATSDALGSVEIRRGDE